MLQRSPVKLRPVRRGAGLGNRWWRQRGGERPATLALAVSSCFSWRRQDTPISNRFGPFVPVWLRIGETNRTDPWPGRVAAHLGVERLIEATGHWRRVLQCLHDRPIA